MLLVVDSGSTKSDWVLLTGDQNLSFNTMGLNPYFHDETTVLNAIRENEGLNSYAANITELFFYGAGCSAPALNAIIEKGLAMAFPNAKIHVDHDLMACAYATYTGVPAISCIIGTGSNSCFFDGTNLSEEVPALGYILGDEGSGSYFGKQLLSNFLYKRLPANIHEAFYTFSKLDKDQIINHVYLQPNPNVYLASMMKFIVQHSDDTYIKEMIFNGFKHFVDIHVTCYANHREVPVHFIGSIAFLFRTELEKACTEFGVQIGNIVQKPIDGLIHFHQQNLVKLSN
jgi:N-acetylglucosamine kinase-like BadF-type ATPase